MGLESNREFDNIEDSSIKLDEFLPFENSAVEKVMDTVTHTPVNKSKNSVVLRMRNRTTSRSERQAKGKSTSELWARSSPKNVSDKPHQKKRPSSQFYDVEDVEIPVKEESRVLSNGEGNSSKQSFSSIDPSNFSSQTPQSISRHLPLHTSTPQLSPSDSLMQRFRKSFAVRFKKKNDESSSVGLSSKSISTPKAVLNQTTDIKSPSDKQKLIALSNRDLTVRASPRSDFKNTSPNDQQKNLFSNNSNGRKRQPSADWRRSVFYDSVDSVLNVTTKSESDDRAYLSGSDANILRKRAASTSDYSPKSKTVECPVSCIHDVKVNNLEVTKIPVQNGQFDEHVLLASTADSDEHKNLNTFNQIWRANPVKLCRVHSRLMMCRHRGRYRLRRSISQPVELEMSGSIHNLKDSVHGSADQENFQKTNLSSDDEASSESDIYNSYCCSPTRKVNACWELTGEEILHAQALWDHETQDTEELAFRAGDTIEVTDSSDQDWWWGSKDGQEGWFPAAFVRLYVSHKGPSLQVNGQGSDGIHIYSPGKDSINNLTPEQIRASIVKEIVDTEGDYVKHLKDVVDGYLKQVQRRPDMFNEERIETIFGNVTEIYSFQKKFLKQLDRSLNVNALHLSQIGNSFLSHKEEFKMYSEYCNNHPLAVNELQELYCDRQYIHFFEACRLIQEMIDISLDGFLLTPIQRICKYPLQLAELLKHTDTSHPDYVPVKNALAAMKEVAELVNERKRRMECLERIAEWQNSIEGWEGPDILDTSSILIHYGEVTRVSSSWSRDIYLFIFDHLLIYCKKDILKRHTYAYKGRLILDHCDILDIEDGRDSQFTVNVRNAWKIYYKDKEKWFLFYAKSPAEKEQWIKAFKSERQRVTDDKKQAFVVTEDAKKSARLAVQNKLKPKRPRAKFNKGRRCHPDVAVTELLLDSPSAKARSGSLPSNIHPELAIMAGAKLGPPRKKGSGWFHFGSGKKPKS